jgi:predicted  nucleic acid-binding Zn-ribbon protein
MSPIAVMLDLLLAGLLILTLFFGLRLERNLKALRKSQSQFVGAVSDLDQAAARAEAGLAELRGAVEEASSLLSARIEKARELTGKLEGLTRQAAAQESSAREAVARAAVAKEAPREVAAKASRSALDRAWSRPAGREPAAEEPPLTLTRENALAAERRPMQRAPLRSRAQVDDELFEGPQRTPLRASRRP